MFVHARAATSSLFDLPLCRNTQRHIIEFNGALIWKEICEKLLFRMSKEFFFLSYVARRKLRSEFFLQGLRLVKC